MSEPVKLSPQQRKIVAYCKRYGSIDTRTATTELYILSWTRRKTELERMGFKFRKNRIGKVTTYSIEEEPLWK